MRWALAIWLGGSVAACGVPADDPCVAMCEAGALLYGECLDSWDVTWEQAGFAGESGYRDNCAAWSWEVRLLEASAGQSDVVDTTCVEREALFSEGDCAEYTQVDWNTLPWEE